jgi:hypothetical protein
VAISKANGTWIEDKKLLVKIASFVRQKDSTNADKAQERHAENKGRGIEGAQWNSKTTNMGIRNTSTRPTFAQSSGRKSYAQVLANENMPSGRNTTALKSFNLQPAGNSWLQSSAVAKRRIRTSIPQIKADFSAQGLHHIQVKATGEREVILTFPSQETRDEFI